MAKPAVMKIICEQAVEVVTNMCSFSDIIQERAEARAEEKVNRMVAWNLFKRQFPVEVIAEVLETTVVKVNAYLEEKPS